MGASEKRLKRNEYQRNYSKSDAYLNWIHKRLAKAGYLFRCSNCGQRAKRQDLCGRCAFAKYKLGTDFQWRERIIYMASLDEFQATVDLESDEEYFKRASPQDWRPNSYKEGASNENFIEPR
jgi:ribosomal protein L32